MELRPWRELSAQIGTLADDIEKKTGRRPLVVGMDKDRINSWLAFYLGRGKPERTRGRSDTGAAETAGRHLFGGNANRYAFWFPPEVQQGKTMTLVGRKPSDMTGPAIDARIERGGAVHEITVRRNGHPIRRNYYRIIEGYHVVRQTSKGQ